MVDTPASPNRFYRRAIAMFKGYVDSPDPLQRACNIIAMIVVSNQPFYPLYVRYLVAPDNGASCLTFLSTPLFAGIPAIARRWPVAGLAALPVIGLVNAIIATLALGKPAGIELFIIPCVLIAFLAQSPSTRVPIATATTIALATYALVWLSIWPPLHAFTAEQYASLYRLNLFSVGGLALYACVTLIVARRKNRAMTEPS